MNREQRRAYDRKIKNAHNTSICPKCNHKARFVTRAKGEIDTVLICERCGAIIREGKELTKIMPAGIYLPVTLEILDKLLLEEATKIKEDPNEQADSNDPVEAEGSVT